jgi:hypothetical protein
MAGVFDGHELAPLRCRRSYQHAIVFEIFCSYCCEFAFDPDGADSAAGVRSGYCCPDRADRYNGQHVDRKAKSCDTTSSERSQGNEIVRSEEPCLTHLNRFKGLSRSDRGKPSLH